MARSGQRWSAARYRHQRFVARHVRAKRYLFTVSAEGPEAAEAVATMVTLLASNLDEES